jgi:hypothetical protein
MLSRLTFIVLLLSPLGAWAERTTQIVGPDVRSETVAANVKPSSRVVLIERPSAVQEFQVDKPTVKGMFSRALLALTKQTEAAAAWKHLGIVPSDVVGIKITTSGGPLLSTHRALLEEIMSGLRAAGVDPANMILWDKLDDDMIGAGYALSEGDGQQARVRCVVPQTGFDPKQFYVNEIMGRLIWGDYLFVGDRPTKEDLLKQAQQAVARAEKGGDPNETEAVKPANDQISNKSFIAKLVTQTFTKIINVPVLTDHKSFGINGCLSSLAMGSVDNMRRFQQEDIWGEPAILEVLDRDVFRKKVVLHVLDALVAEYAGGPNFNPQFTQRPGALYVSRDPVAIDTLVLPRLEQWREEGLVPPIGERGRHVKEAANYDLGETNLKKIELIQIK